MKWILLIFTIISSILQSIIFQGTGLRFEERLLKIDMFNRSHLKFTLKIKSIDIFFLLKCIYSASTCDKIKSKLIHIIEK